MSPFEMRSWSMRSTPLPCLSFETHSGPMLLWRLDRCVCLVKHGPHHMHIFVTARDYVVVQLPHATSCTLVLAWTQLSENSLPHPSERGGNLPKPPHVCLHVLKPRYSNESPSRSCE
ncbi:hypothetical protein KC19_1G217000 [Ceratodon purpureus]|uniref:Uncharacterized protein n=1 Tax=Ceratodon purpureus TaxID=3225 RepID=A0A8T0JAY4_CERPU|nr:hypothetical protein KC19_1G217000 [Ceratodon purpureus]